LNPVPAIPAFLILRNAEQDLFSVGSLGTKHERGAIFDGCMPLKTRAVREMLREKSH
jgi:hypothetical protein